VHKI